MLETKAALVSAIVEGEAIAGDLGGDVLDELQRALHSLSSGLTEAPGGLADVDVVFLTHLHIDHVGWNADLEGVPLFPRARYVVHEDAFAFAARQDTRPHVRRCILALEDRFERIPGDVELADGVAAFQAPGHYPGHMAVRLSSEGSEGVLLGDVAVHPAMLDVPELRYVSDVDQDTSIATRRAILPELVDRDVVVACGHYPGSGIGRVETRDGTVVWTEA